MNIVELNWNIALNSDYFTLGQLCQSSIQFNSICQDVQFWKQKYIRDFGIPQGFDTNYIQDWNRMYKLHFNIFPKICQFIFSLSRIRQQETIDYIKRAQTLIYRDGPIIMRDQYRTKNIFTFDKVILSELDITFNEFRRTLFIMVHYNDIQRDTEYITTINTTSVNVSDPTRITDSESHSIEEYPDLQNLINNTNVMDYGWQLDIYGVKYGNLYILNPYEFLLLDI